MVELRGDARLAQEACAEVLVAREVRREHLERDRPVELLVPARVDDGHAAAAELAVDAVGAQSPSSVAVALAVVLAACRDPRARTVSTGATGSTATGVTRGTQTRRLRSELR